MNLSEIMPILPLIIPAAAAILLMLLIAFFRNHLLTASVTLISLVFALVMVFVSYEKQPRHISNLFVMDGYAHFFITLIYAAALIVCAMSYGYLKNKQIVREEYYLFLLTTALGCGVLVSSSHFASLFIGIELLSLSLYVLITYTGTMTGIEAGIKYFVMTAVSISFLLFGISLIYAACGTMSFSSVQAETIASTTTNNLLYLAGISMFLIGIGFKLALVPFHYWIADIYEGAPAPVAGFVGTASKGAVFAVLMRYFSAINIPGQKSLYVIFTAIAIASMFFGNITALLQTKIKRILGYSSIAHFGYLLVTLIAGNTIAITAASFYLTSYFITILAIFGIITFLSKGENDFDTLDNYKGLAFNHPFYAASLTIAMFSLAGIPLTAGFIAKLYIILAGANIKLWALLIILIINSLIGLFYYLRIVISFFDKSHLEKASENISIDLSPSFSLPGAFSVGLLLFFLIYLGVAPGHLLHVIENLIKISGV